MQSEGRIGQTKTYAGRERAELPYGNGCPMHDDCFSCPLPDCKSSVTYYDSGVEPPEELTLMAMNAFDFARKELPWIL
uniref:Uncharacterized protein n=1 Tax=viral metagenome TaxID=1070528 RepID=A0A6M3XZ03_9ZZZZ